MLHKPNHNTQRAFEELDEIIEQEKAAPAQQSFPYTTRELAELVGIGNSQVYNYLLHKGMQLKGKRWFYRHNPPTEEA